MDLDYRPMSGVTVANVLPRSAKTNFLDGGLQKDLFQLQNSDNESFNLVVVPRQPVEACAREG